MDDGRSDAPPERDENFCDPLVILVPVSMVVRPAATALLRATGIRPPLSLPHPRLWSHRQFFTSPPSLPGKMSETSEFYNLKAKLPGDKEYNFEQLRGKVVLIVNVASKW